MLHSGPKVIPGVGPRVGLDRARLPEGVGEYGPVAGLEFEPLPDPRPMPDELASAGYFTAEEARWLSGWLDLLLAGRGRIYTEAPEPRPQRGLAGYEVSL